MQVTIHSIESARVVDFTTEEMRPHDGPPFVNVELRDGKGSTVQMLLRNYADVERLFKAVREAESILREVVPIS